jgi:hypothetical protein
MRRRPEFIRGTCTQLLFSPKGDIEGAMVSMRGRMVQISCDHAVGESLGDAPGKTVRVLASADHSKKTKDQAHPVFEFVSFANAAGQKAAARPDPNDDVTVTGVVASLHYARHGQPNGVMLRSGEFIHLRPEGMVKAALKVGSKVEAFGDLRHTTLGTPLLEARHVNRTHL